MIIFCDYVCLISCPEVTGVFFSLFGFFSGDEQLPVSFKVYLNPFRHDSSWLYPSIYIYIDIYLYIYLHMCRCISNAKPLSIETQPSINPYINLSVIYMAEKHGIYFDLKPAKHRITSTQTKSSWHVWFFVVANKLCSCSLPPSITTAWKSSLFWVFFSCEIESKAILSTHPVMAPIWLKGRRALLLTTHLPFAAFIHSSCFFLYRVTCLATCASVLSPEIDVLLSNMLL